jgi:hypothetical protein
MMIYLSQGVPHATYFLTWRLHLPNRLRAGTWWHGSPPGFSI